MINCEYIKLYDSDGVEIDGRLIREGDQLFMEVMTPPLNYVSQILRNGENILPSLRIVDGRYELPEMVCSDTYEVVFGKIVPLVISLTFDDTNIFTPSFTIIPKN